MKSLIWKPFTIQGVSPEPHNVISGNGLYLKLQDGRKIKDMISSWWVNLHGHSHPYIARAIYEQAQKLEHVIFADYTHDPAEKLANKLHELSNGLFGKVFFSDNGSTTVEVALKISRQYWINQGKNQRNRVLAFDGAYHGDTFGAMSAGARGIFSDAFSDWMFDVDRVEYPSTWVDDCDRESKEEQALLNIEALFENAPDSFAALIIEPLVQGAGGMRMCRSVFLQKLVQLAKKYHVLVIFDEVMTGFGRTGNMFAFQNAEVQPDLICLSKGLTGGFLPMSVTLVTDRVFEPFNSPDSIKTFWHGHSYTANPLGCAAAIASLEVFESGESDYGQLSTWYTECIKRLVALQNVEKIRQCGTILAFDVKTHARQSGYLDSVGHLIKSKALERGMLIRPLGNVVYFMPPYCITKEELEESCHEIIGILKELN
jgi:adenosylmethionine---8-amino-7-oxononanoate aminotransferase